MSEYWISRQTSLVAGLGRECWGSKHSRVHQIAVQRETEKIEKFL